MPNQNDQPTNNTTEPVKSDGTGTNASLEKTHFFNDDSTPSSRGSESSSEGGSPKLSASKKQKIVGGYRLIKMLGEGGMGRVFQAVDESGRMIAIKLLSPELSRSPEALDRFKQEGVIASAISHPNCVFVHRADEDSGTPFIAMELMTGRTLKDIVSERGPIPYTEAIPLVLQCIDGLIEAHSRGMIHRDVKPANCYLDIHGNVKIGDFGLARSLVSDSELTRTGSFLGTPLYASPEQILGEQVDEQSDIYSLAATIYFLLAGKAPFESPHATQVIAKIVSADPPTFSEAGVQVPKMLEQMVLRGLARDRSKRYSSFQEFRDDLAQTLERRERVATLPRRVLAYTIDTFLISLSIGLALLLSFAFGENQLDFKYYINLLGSLWQGLYLFGSESLFGTTIGKRLLNLRVVDPELGTRPRLKSCLIRSLLFFAFINLIEFSAAPFISPVEAPISYAAISWFGFVAGCIAILSVWKRTAKKQLLHEWLSRTQTWVTAQKSVINAIELPEPLWTFPTQPLEMNLGVPSHLGRFEIHGKIPTVDNSNWLSAHDSTIEREVWIQLSPATFPPPSESREKCVRRTRMRFLESGIQNEWRWDAYVAPDGAPIALWFDSSSPMPWPVTLKVLQDAIEEIKSNESSQNAKSIALARWWLTSSGKLTLSEAAVKVAPIASEIPHDSKSLFSEIASLAIPDRRRVDRISNSVWRANLKPSNRFVAPWRATQLLQKLGSGKVTDPNVIQSELHRVVQGPQSVTVTMRVVHAAILAMMLFIPWMILSFASVIPVLIAIVDEQKDARSFTTLAAVLKDPVGHSGLIEQIGEVKRSEYLKPERIATIETIAKEQHEHFDKAYRHLGFLERGLMELMNRVRGREDFAAIPTPDFSKLEHVAERDASLNQSSNEKVKAKAPGIRISQGNNFKVAQIEDAPESVDSIILRLERLESERNAPAPVNWLGRLRDLIILPLCAIVVWGGIFRGGISHAITGLAVVRNDGRRGGILQCMWRSLLFWFPLLAIAGVILVVDAHGTDGVWWTQQLRRCFFVLPVLYLVAVIRWPSRGPHDLVSGTFVVPR